MPFDRAIVKVGKRKSPSRLVWRILLLVTLTVLTPTLTISQTFTVVHAFSLGDGHFPMAPVAFDGHDNLYGTTLGGTTGASVFKIDSLGRETVRFLRPDQGAYTESGPLIDPAGNVYGTSSSGGRANLGTVWELTSTGKLLDLLTFGTKGLGGIYGADPLGGLSRDKLGNIYGTAYYGGNPFTGCGTLYKIGPGGTFSTLYQFLNVPDGCDPLGPVLLGQDGNIYGVTCDGGANGWGTLYKFDLTTGTETVLYNFSNGDDGGSPTFGLVQDAQGVLYGTTYGGGTQKAGTIFKFDLASKMLTSLWNFGQNNTYGASPRSGPVLD